MARAHRRHHTEEEDSYFISMTDLMVGLLFIFIIMLMFFALQFKEAREQADASRQARDDINRELTSEIDRLRNAEEVRRRILEDVKRLLEEEGVEVHIDEDQGVLRLPEEVLFAKGQADLDSDGRQAIGALARALEIVLPCYTKGPFAEKNDCPEQIAIVEAIFIEGHTDNDPLTPRAGMRDNLDLSAMRATNTFRELMNASEGSQDGADLRQFLNTRGVPVLSVSGYGEYRPMVENQITEAEKALNRRIDLRILMTTPRSEEIETIQDDINRAGGSANP